MQQAQQAVKPAQPRTTAQPPTALVVGAGPGGVLAASFLAQRGLRVRVFEKRPEDGHVALRNSLRTFNMALNGRAVRTFREAGLETETIGKRPFKGVGSNNKIFYSNPNSTPLRTLYFVDRMTLGKELVEAARQQTFPEGGSIEWHFGQALEDVDFDARTATFVPSSSASTSGQDGDSSAAATTSSRIVAKYDLLVGADGSNSVVRAKMLEHKVPGLEARTALKMLSTYKTYHGMPLTPTVAKALPGIAQWLPGETITFLRKTTRSGRPTFGTVWKRTDGTCSGSFTGPMDWYTDEELRERLDALLSGGLEEWTEAAYEQTCSASGQEPSRISTITKLSQFHGPSTVLVGDAAHPVTPSMGQGCNSALESARVLAETLDKVGLERLEQLPAAYNAARIRDAHAVQDIDYSATLLSWSSPVVVGPEQRPPNAWQRLSAFVEVVLPTLTVWPLLKLLAPKHFVEPTFSFHLLGDPDMPYERVKLLSRVIGWSLAVALAAAAAVLVRAVARSVLGVVAA